MPRPRIGAARRRRSGTTRSCGLAPSRRSPWAAPSRAAWGTERSPWTTRRPARTDDAGALLSQGTKVQDRREQVRQDLVLAVDTPAVLARAVVPIRIPALEALTEVVVVLR